MNFLRLIGVFLLLFVASASHAQDSRSANVVVHSDPRLSLLVKKPHNMEVTASNITKPAPAKRKPIAASTPATEKPSAKSSGGVATKSTTSKEVTVANAAPYVSKSAKPGKAVPVKVSNDEASTTGHAGGWTPPVYRKARSVSSGKGFRVQIYNGPDRGKAIEIKTAFMRSYPGIHTYLTYIAPCFRVKVGDYRNRAEALGMLKEANSIYSPCMIVPDVINVRSF